MSEQLKHESKQNIGIPKSIRFIFGGTVGIVTTCVVHPFFVLKNRMQMSGEGGKIREHKTSFHAVHNLIKNEGFKGLYVGLSAATIVTIRFRTYTTLFEQFNTKYGTPPGFSTKIFLGMTAGAIGQFLGDVLFRVIRNEGFFSLWKGFTPYYIIVGPYTVLSFILIEKLNQFYMKYILGLNTSGGGL